MKLRILLAAAVFVTLTAFAPIPFPKPKQSAAVALKNLDGVWEIVKTENKYPAKGKKGRSARRHVRIENGKWTYMPTADAEMSGRATYHIILDTAKEPTWLDLKRDPNGPTTYMKGLLQINGEEVKLIYTRSSLPRPTDFTPKLNGQIKLTLKRIKKP